MDLNGGLFPGDSLTQTQARCGCGGGEFTQRLVTVVSGHRCITTNEIGGQVELANGNTWRLPAGNCICACVEGGGVGKQMAI